MYGQPKAVCYLPHNVCSEKLSQHMDFSLKTEADLTSPDLFTKRGVSKFRTHLADKTDITEKMRALQGLKRG